MAYFDSSTQREEDKKTKFYKKKWFKVVAIIFAVFAFGGGIFAWKTGRILNKISGGNSGFLSSLVHQLPGVEDTLKGEKDGRINVLLLGMRGENVPGGGLLADTVIVVSIGPKENKVAMISVPRDLYVTVPGTSDKQKINAVHYYGEQKSKGEGLEAMKTIIGEITGLPIHYAISINFEGFKKLIEAVGGIQIQLDSPFAEALQFRGLEKRCDGITFTVPSGNYEEKRIQRKNGTYYANPKRYPLCFAKVTNPENLECGGNFKLPAGDNTLNGEQALCYVRSRVTSSDFERAKRQQIVLGSLKDKLTSIGTLTDINKVNNILNALGDNVRTDMQAWEMKKFLEIYKSMQNTAIAQRVLENSEEGLLYNPPETKETGYILLPIGDNYDRIHEMAKNIFSLPPQTDIKPK